MTYTSRYLIPLSFVLSASVWACSSSDDIPENGDGDGTGTGNAPGDGDTGGDGDGTATGGAAGDGDATGGVTGDGDATGGVAGDGDGDGTGGVSGDGDGDVAAPVDPPGQSCALGTNYDIGEMRILNNQWTSTQDDQCIFINEDRSFGWSWDNTGTFNALPTSNAMNPNYPEVEFGINPWGRQQDAWEVLPSSTTLLPIRLADVTQASMTINISTTLGNNNQGSWNLAFELWLSPVDPSTQETDPSGELMVFLGNNPNYYPTPTDDAYVGTPTIGEYTLFESNGDRGYTYLQWRKSGSDSTSGANFNDTLDIKPFLDHAVSAGQFDANWYITRFEIGNEVYAGAAGETTINSLSFSVNGESRSAM